MSTSTVAGSALARRCAASAIAAAGIDRRLEEFGQWMRGRAAAGGFDVRRIPFDQLRNWAFDPDTGNLGHRSGRFFTVEGLSVHTSYGPVGHWTQPIINQPEVGILGIAVKEIGGVLHCLMQAKMEPGNAAMVQLSPTVQATRSNYTRVHEGSPVPYLDLFTSPQRRTLVDVLQSEQGAWFYRKQNRNMVVEVTGDVPEHDAFRWMTLAEVHRLLAADDVVNMDARTVLSCLPFAGGPAEEDDPFTAALLRSMDPEAASVWSTGEILSWITEARSLYDLRADRIAMAKVSGWRRDEDAIRHEDGKHFAVVAVDVQANDREVASWTQPLLEPQGRGVIGFLAKRIEGVLHVLTHARVEAGYLDVVELAPTVQCTPDNYADWDEERHPRYLSYVLSAPPERVRYRALQSEEGGRFLQALNEYMVIEVEDDFPHDTPPDYRWMTLHQLTGLLRHSHYLNVQARTLVACLNSLRS